MPGTPEIIILLDYIDGSGLQRTYSGHKARVGLRLKQIHALSTGWKLEPGPLFV